jgi:iron complex transport system substrate-binding protein
MRKPSPSSLLAASTVALAGCGTTSVAAPTGSAAPAASAECATDATTTSTGPVSVTDALGRTVKLDKPAERVAVLEWQQVEDALTLCVTPSPWPTRRLSTVGQGRDSPEGVKDVGTAGAEPRRAVPDQARPRHRRGADPRRRDHRPAREVRRAGARHGRRRREDPVKQLLATFDLIAQATGRTERAADVATEMKNHLAEAKKTLAAAKPSSTDFVYFDGWVDGGTVSLRPSAPVRSSARSAASSGSRTCGRARPIPPTGSAARTSRA